MKNQESTSRSTWCLALGFCLCVLTCPLLSGQGFDPYGGTLDLSCTYPAANAATQSFSNGSCNGTSCSLTVTNGAAYLPREIVFVSGTGTAMDNATSPGAYYVVTGIAGNVLTLGPARSHNVPTVSSPQTGTIFWARFYAEKLRGADGNPRWFLCTPQGHAIFLTSIYGTDIASMSHTDYQGINLQSVLQKKYAKGPAGANKYNYNVAYYASLRMKNWGFNTLDTTQFMYMNPTYYDIGFAPIAGTNYNPVTPMNTVASTNVLGNYAPWNKFKYAPGAAKTYKYSCHESVCPYWTTRSLVDATDPNVYLWTRGQWTDSGSTTGSSHSWSSYWTSPGGVNLDRVVYTAQMDQDEMLGTGDGAAFPSSIFGVFYNNLAMKDPQWGYTVISSTPVQYAKPNGLLSRDPPGTTTDMLYVNQPDYLGSTDGVVQGWAPNFYDKIEMARWLQGQTDALSGGSASRAGGIVTVTIAPGDPSEPFVAGEMVDVSACSDPSFNGTGRTLLTAGGAQLTFALPGAGSSATGCTITTSAATAARASGAVTLAFPGPFNFIRGELINVTGCSDSTFNTVAGSGVMVTGVTSTSLTYALGGTGTSATGCIVKSGPGYSSIAALNSAWAATNGGKTYAPNYDSFGSDAVAQAPATATGDGTTRSFSFILTCGSTCSPGNPVTPDTVSVTVNGSPVAGDDAWGPNYLPVGPCGNIVNNNLAGRFTNGVVNGSNVNQTCSTANSYINYNTGAVTVVFTTAPANGAAIAVNYSTGGWTKGHGLLDEDGTCPSKTTGSCWLGGINDQIFVYSFPGSAVSFNGSSSAISRTGGVTTAKAANSLSAGQKVMIFNTFDTSYEGIFTVASANSTTFTYNQAGLPDAIASTDCFTQPQDANVNASFSGGTVCPGYFAVPYKALLTDMQNLEFHLYKRYGEATYHAVKDASPDVMVTPTNQLGGHGTAPSCPAFQAEMWYSDLSIIAPVTDGNNIMTGKYPQWLGTFQCNRISPRDQPWLSEFAMRSDGSSTSGYYGGVASNPAACVSGASVPCGPNSISGRATAYVNEITSFLSTPGPDGINHYTGIAYWSLWDQQTWGSSGLITARDDPYDGRADTPNAGIGILGLYTGCQGADALPGPTTPCEQQSYGNLVGSVAHANALWLNYVRRKPKAVSGRVSGTP